MIIELGPEHCAKLDLKNVNLVRVFGTERAGSLVQGRIGGLPT